ncbi:conserved hypothetical protein [Alkaliphilus metalliredigens QYMF]|uniref:Uncharacterized protein n=1 Tax=Alkaliphilus metalliredigens (strain QYMF) TaxID=293826 RepID=A6TJB1_ALKMQ|nr:hypothetical protein [Alkaliphilus metalliredigens]ABR46279.1 conserved hypothetical protein [Alkaliphilus metalliredigens QYMF]
MSYVLVKEKMIDSEEILKSIEEEFSFKKIKDITSGSKRDDTLIYQIIHDVKQLKKEIEAEGEMGQTEEEELIEELMSVADEKVVIIEEVIPEGLIAYGYSYHYDEGLEEIKSIFIASDESIGELRLRDIADRVLRSID